jgi:hypothetical protein
MNKIITVIMIFSFSSCLFVPRWETSMKPKSLQKSDSDFIGPTYIHWIGHSRHRPFIIFARFPNYTSGKETMHESQFCPPILENLNDNMMNLKHT